MNAQTLDACLQSSRRRVLRPLSPDRAGRAASAPAHVPGLPTADVGCGSGRDTAWLTAHGYPTTGYDASPAMLTETRTAYPHIDVHMASLPDLAGVPSGAYTNVLCADTLVDVRQEA